MQLSRIAPGQYRTLCPITALPADAPIAIDTIPAGEPVEILMNRAETGIAELRWRDRRYRVFSADLTRALERTEYNETH